MRNVLNQTFLINATVNQLLGGDDAPMTIPANTNGTYFLFDNYSTTNPGDLQVPHDASIKVSFDTSQIIDDIGVPYGNWGKASYLEPITQDFPQFGSGGAAQVITHSKIKIDLIIKSP